MLNTVFNRACTPWDEYETMERVFDDIFRGAARSKTTSGKPKATHWVEDDEAHVLIELPGVSKKDVEISLEGKTLTISGHREAPEAAKDNEAPRRERWHGKFARTYTLPFNAEQGNVKAEFENGILEISIPKAETEKPRKIAIK